VPVGHVIDPKSSVGFDDRVGTQRRDLADLGGLDLGDVRAKVWGTGVRVAESLVEHLLERFA
jgi:hypothetical protein